MVRYSSAVRRIWVGLLLVLLAGACSDDAETTDAPSVTATPPVVAPANNPSPETQAAEQAAETAADPVPALGEPIRFLDSELQQPVGTAPRHGMVFLAEGLREYPAPGDILGCETRGRFGVVGSSGLLQTVEVPGTLVGRVEIGPAGWGFAATACVGTSWLVPLRVVNGQVVVVDDPDTGAAQMFPANVERAYTYYAPVGSLWRSDTVVSVRPQGGLDERYELDLSTGEREAPTELAVDRQTSDGRPQIVLASGAHAPGTFYTVPAQSCFGHPEEVTTVRVISAGRDRAVIDDPGDTFTGLAQMIFGADDQVAWLNTCNSVSSVWVATVDPVTGEFHAVTRVIDEDWLATAGWGFSGDGYFGPISLAFEETGELVVWAHTDHGLEVVRSTQVEAGSHAFADPVVAIAIYPEAPTPIAAPSGLPRAEVSDVDITLLASFWPAGTAERAGLVFYALEGNAAEVGVESCDQATSPIFGFGDSPVPEQVAVVPGTQVASFNVNWSGAVVAVSSCGDATYVSVGEFDVATRTIVAGSLNVWKRDLRQSAPALGSNGEVRWGPYTFDPTTRTWQIQRRSRGVVFEKGHSDSGRYRYFSTPGHFGDETGPIDPSVRLMVEDTRTGIIRQTTDSPRGAAAWRLIFGPDDEVAWMTGNELGTSAYLGRIDWVTGEIVEAYQVRSDPPLYWGHPRSGSGKGGPDAIAFEPDGMLRAWAYTYEPGNPDPSTWTVDSATFTLESLAALPDS